MTQAVADHRHMFEKARSARTTPGFIPEICATCGQERLTPHPPVFNGGIIPEPIPRVTRQATSAPVAQVIDVQRARATITCPYCGRRHSHTVREHGAQRFSPGCGLYRNPAERQAGYIFTTEEGARP